MAEIKNNFTSSRMNQDIDDRLMPNNEYRYALNLEVNRSEASDVGTLQNILGNSLSVDFNLAAQTTGLQCIGAYADESSNNIYVFLTNHSGSDYDPNAKNYIYVYNNQSTISYVPNSSNPTLLVKGAFLNFSIDYPIYGINLIENLLFWTDNRNQPRKINVQKAYYNTINNIEYYTTEEQISVAKLNPLSAPELFKVSNFNLPLVASAAVGTVTGTGPYEATITPTTPFIYSLLKVGNTVHATAGTSSFTSGIVTSITTVGSNITSFVISSTTIFTSGNISSLYTDQYETTMYDVVSATLPDEVTANPYLINKWPGDPAYLESKYVRFSYRYKFEDGEYSIMAPFTQIAYIPKQDGYFLYGGVATPDRNDEENSYRSTIVNFMQNKVNNILLQIPLPNKPIPVIIPPATTPVYIPCPANQVSSMYKIVEIEILYKEADGLAVSVLDVIPTAPDATKGISPAPPYFWNTTSEVYSYTYQSKKPFKTLPSRDLIRVNDITPVKALSQEVVGNRVVYGNYQDKYSYPKYLDYNVGAGEKSTFGIGYNKGTSRIEYPNHSLKQNRNYQIGIILGDRFGRESGVILSDKATPGDEEGQNFGASTLYVPYTKALSTIAPSEWPGDSLKILFNSTITPITPTANTGWPGIYNGDSTSPDYNPLGWYSYKVVVKQTEQDYYNVYLPGTMAAYPTNATLELGKTSHIVLLNDNINKVPRDLAEVGPGQQQFRSSVILFPRVNNNLAAYDNQQYYPNNTYAFVNTIATNNSLFFIDGVVPTPNTVPDGFNNFYQIKSDPLIARISTPAQLGVVTSNTGTEVINLSVYETKPVESKLDIYWETSTSGVISELNAAVSAGSTDSIKDLIDWSFILTEASAPGSYATGPFYFTNDINNPISPTNVVIQSVTTGANGSVNVTNKFVIEKIPGGDLYRIKTAPGAYFYYGDPTNNAQRYNFEIFASIGTPVVSAIIPKNGFLTNIVPTITNKPTGPVVITQYGQPIYTFTGVNGSNSGGGKTTEGLSWAVTNLNGTPNPLFSISSTGVLTNPGNDAYGEYDLKVTLTDTGGLTDYTNINVTAGNYQTYTGDLELNDIADNDSATTTGILTNYGKEVELWGRAISTCEYDSYGNIVCSAVGCTVIVDGNLYSIVTANNGQTVTGKLVTLGVGPYDVTLTGVVYKNDSNATGSVGMFFVYP